MKQKRVLMVLFYASLSPRQELMLEALKKLGWFIAVLAWDRDGNTPIPSNNHGIFDDWCYVQVPAPTWSSKVFLSLPKYYLGARKAIGSINEPDLVILTHFFLLPLAFFLKGKKVYDDADMYFRAHSYYFGPVQPLAQPILAVLNRLMVAGVEGVTCIDSKSGWLEKYYRSWKRVQVIWNVPSIEGETGLEDNPGPLEVFAERRIVAYAGGLMREKGLRVSLEAAASVRKKYPSALFLFMGPMKDNPEAIDQLIDSYDLTDNVLFLGKLPYRKMLAYLHLAEIGLAPYLRELQYPLVSTGTGRKFFTYMQAALPIVGPDFGEIGSIVTLTNCGILVDTDDSMEVAQAILYLLDNPEEARQMGERGRRAILDRYNWEREKIKFRTFIENVVNLP